MKTVKVSIVLALVIMCISSCQANADNKHNAEYLTQRVENIYKDVAEVYNKCNEGGEMSLESLNNANFEEKYCSQAWNAMLAKISAIDSALPEDEIGFFDADYWIDGQDFSNVSASDVKVVKIEGEKATVTFNLHNCGSMSAITLTMVFERDDWFIDDFHNGFFSWMQGMREYVDAQAK